MSYIKIEVVAGDGGRKWSYEANSLFGHYILLPPQPIGERKVTAAGGAFNNSDIANKIVTVHKLSLIHI